MARIIVTQYISLDGVIEDPVGMENSGLGDWTGPFQRGPAGDAFKEDELRNASAVMLGRRTYDGFAAVWPHLKSDAADRMNALPKYLASRSISTPAWNNTTVLGSDLAEAALQLKASTQGNIVVYGSASVCHALMFAGLVDEFALMLYPVVLGRGVRLFPDGATAHLALIDVQTFGDGIQLLRYQA